ncbi:MAG TPA: class I SAM-dependent methyltransferase [Burkholderiaceae bacterium]|nr:class I SAM-dependent methyltransferase [Burkholderiaceae bacterium]
MYAFPLERDNLETYSVTATEQEPLSEASPEVRRALTKLPDYEKIESVLSDLLPRKGHVVEVGAHSGLLLGSFRSKGWKVTGIEPDGRAVEFARRAYDIDVRRATLLSTDLEDGCADAVVMLHVIEHLDDPAANLRVVSRILRDDGVFVVETPIYDTLAYRLLGRRERSLSCDGHIFFYTQATLSRLLTDCGFTILRSERVGRTMSLSRLLWNFGVMSKSTSAQRMLKAVIDRPSLHSRHIHLNAKDMLRIYARRSLTLS